jgi:hypothetical protein
MLEALWEGGALNPAQTYGQTRPSDETKPPEQKRLPSGTKINTSVTLRERYDSNVFNTPSGFDIGRTKWDFVTSLAPTVELLNKNRYAETTVNAGLNGSVFVNNPDLKFISTFLTGAVGLDSLVGKVIRGAKLRVSDSFSFSPETPSFTSASTPTVTDNPFARGLVPVRANIYQNTVAVKAEYPFSTTLSLQGGYSYSLLRVGDVKVTAQPTEVVPIVFFNSDYHEWSMGPNWKLSRTDNISIMYKGTTISLRDTSGQAVDTTFTAQGAEAFYATKASDWGLVASGGATVLQERAYATGSLALSAKYGESTVVYLTGSRQMAPAFFGVPGALISTTGGISVEQKFTKSLSLTGNGNYAYSQVAPAATASFDSYTASALLAYNFSRSITTSLQYSFTYFELSSSNQSGAVAPGYLVNRHIAMLSITAVFN